MRARLVLPHDVEQCELFLFSICRILRLKSRFAHAVRWTTSTQLVPLDFTREELPHGGYAGVRLGEAQIPGPAAHKRDVADEPCARRTRINEQHQEARTPSREEFGILQLSVLQQRSPLAQSQPRRRCPILGDPFSRRVRQQREYHRGQKKSKLTLFFFELILANSG